ncbi:TPA: hypothetical protein ACGWVL_001310 [Pseudomonas aeruginosa]
MSLNLLDTIDLNTPATYRRYLSPWEFLRGMSGGGRFGSLVDDTRKKRLAQIGQPMTEQEWADRISLLTERFGSVSDGHAELISKAILFVHTKDGIGGETILAALKAAQVQTALYAREALELQLLPHEEWLVATVDDSSSLTCTFGEEKAHTVHRMVKLATVGNTEGITVMS